MPSPPEDAQLGHVPAEIIAQLAILYDRFAQALDPFTPERDQAELQFDQQVARLYDELPRPKPGRQDFRKAIILCCRRHLRATSKPPSL